MKNIFIITFLLLPLLGVGQIDSKKLEQRDGLFYEANKSEPFTGIALTYFPDGTTQLATEYKAGILNGKFEGWYLSGKKQVEGALINGQKTGLWLAWYENGQKLRKGSFKNGKEEGEYLWWFENDSINKKGTYHNGVSDGKWEWYYENGKKKQEGFLIAEKEDSTWKEWYENGNKKMVGSFKNGLKEGDWTWWEVQGKVTTNKVYKEGLLVEGTDDLDNYIEKMQFYMEQRDFNQALDNIEKAISTIDDKTENNKIYMSLVVYQSKVYSWFQHLDKAERVLLKTTGISTEDVDLIIKSINPNFENDLQKLVEKINTNPTSETLVGPHLTLALIYNILGDSINLRKEQQLIMERSEMSDWVINFSMELYKVRGRKENAYGYINRIKEAMLEEGETRQNQQYLAYYLYEIGKFQEAGIIADKYLTKNKYDLDFLYVKMNIEMVLGNITKMKEYEDIILKINPKALER
jgi:antitoxin component YwqK of YwqJK toxin-antitoxin module